MFLAVSWSNSSGSRLLPGQTTAPGALRPPSAAALAAGAATAPKLGGPAVWNLRLLRVHGRAVLFRDLGVLRLFFA